MTSIGVSQVAQAETETKLKAAFTYNFTKYVHWPEATERSGGELRLCVFKSPEILKELETVAGKTIRNYTLSVRELNGLDEISGCHLAYSNGSKNTEALIKAVADKPVLTVGDDRDFLDEGGIVQLFRDGRQIRFDINLEKARALNLQISSRLLQLAREVKR